MTCPRCRVPSACQRPPRRELKNRLIAVPRDSHREKSDKDARDLPKQVRQEIEKFFVATDELEAKTLKFLGWKGPKVGKRLIDDAAKSFKRVSKAS